MAESSSASSKPEAEVVTDLDIRYRGRGDISEFNQDRRLREMRREHQYKEKKEMLMFSKLTRVKNAGGPMSARALKWLEEKSNDPKVAEKLAIHKMATDAMSDEWALELKSVMKGESDGRFSSVKSITVEEKLKQEVVGLFTKEDYKKKREELLEEERQEKLKKDAADAAALAVKEERKAKRAKETKKGLSFNFEENDDN